MNSKLTTLIACILACPSFALAEENKLDPIRLRYGSTYYFGHSFINTSGVDAWITQVSVKFFEGGDFDGNKEFIEFPYSKEVMNSRLIPSSSGPVPLVKSESYPIKYYPRERAIDGEADIEITYTVMFSPRLPDGSWKNEDTIMNDSQPYIITRCGDGVVDKYEDLYTAANIYEQCDPHDTSKTGWGKRGCSDSCEIIN